MSNGVDQQMKIKEVCDYLGISRATLYRRIKQGRIIPLPPNPAKDRRDVLLFNRKDIEALLERASQQAS